MWKLLPKTIYIPKCWFHTIWITFIRLVDLQMGNALHWTQGVGVDCLQRGHVSFVWRSKLDQQKLALKYRTQSLRSHNVLVLCLLVLVLSCLIWLFHSSSPSIPVKLKRKLRQIVFPLQRPLVVMCKSISVYLWLDTQNRMLYKIRFWSDSAELLLLTSTTLWTWIWIFGRKKHWPCLTL